MSALAAGSGGTKVTSNEELQETAGPVYSESLAAESQSNGGSFADGKTEEQVASGVDTSRNVQTSNLDSTEGAESKAKDIKSSDKTDGVKSSNRLDDTNSSDKSSGIDVSDKAKDEYPSSGKGIVEHSQHTSAPGPTGTAPGESIESTQEEQHTLGTTTHEVEEQDNQSHNAKNSVHEDSISQQQEEKESSKTEEVHKKSDNQPSSASTHEEPSQGKGVPEHLHHSFAGAPGPIGTAPGEAVELQESHASKEQNSGPTPQNDAEVETPVSSEWNQSKSSPEDVEPLVSKESDQSKPSPEEVSDEQVQDKPTHNQTHSESSTETRAQGKGVPEHPHHSAAAAPGPTGTSPGESLESTPDQETSHESSSSKAQTISNKEHSGEELPQPVESSTRHQYGQHQEEPAVKEAGGSTTGTENQVQGKGIPEHPHHSAAVAPGPTGTSPGESLESTPNKDASHKDSAPETETTPSKSEHPGKDLPQPVENSTRHEHGHHEGKPKAEEAAPSDPGTTNEAQGKGVPEHPHHSDAGAPGPTGTSPGEAMEEHEDTSANTKEEKMDELKEQGNEDTATLSTSKSDIGLDAGESGGKEVKLEEAEDDKTASSASQNNEASSHHAGKGIPETKHHFTAGAPGATGTAPGEAMTGQDSPPSTPTTPQAEPTNTTKTADTTELTSASEPDTTNAPAVKHEKHDSVVGNPSGSHSKSVEQHEDTPATGKGILEHGEVSVTGAPGATGTAPGQAM